MASSFRSLISDDHDDDRVEWGGLHKIVLVMGRGKTVFIRRALSDSFMRLDNYCFKDEIGRFLPGFGYSNPCLPNIDVYKLRTNDEVITLVEVPDPDNGYYAQQFELVVNWLAAIYSEGLRIRGIVCLEDISRREKAYSSSRPTIFRTLIGAAIAPNLMLVTSCWEGGVDLVLCPERRKDPIKGQLRLDERYLRNEAILKEQKFHSMLKKGARYARFICDEKMSYRQCALDIIGMVVDGPGTPLTIQREMIDEGKVAAETNAGQRMCHMFDMKIKREWGRERGEVADQVTEEMRKDKNGKWRYHEIQRLSLMERRTADMDRIAKQWEVGITKLGKDEIKMFAIRYMPSTARENAAKAKVGSP